MHLTITQRRLIKAMRENPDATNEQLSVIVGVKPKTVANLMTELKRLMAASQGEGDDELTHDIMLERYRHSEKYWRVQHDKIIRRKSMEAIIIEHFHDKLQGWQPPIVKPSEYAAESFSPNNAMLVLSDWHFGGSVQRDEVMGINNYNRDTELSRVQQVIDKFQRVAPTGDTLYIAALGDMIEGLINDSFYREGAVADSVLHVVDELYRVITTFAPSYKSIVFVGIYGNHGRMVQQKYYTRAYDNFDYLAYRMLEKMFSGVDNVTFVIPQSPWVVLDIGTNGIGTKSYFLCHGEGLKGGGSKGPAQWDALWSSVVGKIDYAITGHLHHMSLKDKIGGGMFIQGGSLKGSDSYSLGSGFPHSVASQLGLTIDKTGEVVAVSQLRLT